MAAAERDGGVEEGCGVYCTGGGAEYSSVEGSSRGNEAPTRTAAP